MPNFTIAHLPIWESNILSTRIYKSIRILFHNRIHTWCLCFGNCIAFREITPDILSGFSESLTYEELNKLAVNYSDGLTLPTDTTLQSLAAYAEERGVKVLREANIDNPAAFAEFYDNVWSEGKDQQEE